MKFYHSLDTDKLLSLSKDIVQKLSLMSFLLISIASNQEKRLKEVAMFCNKFMHVFPLQTLWLNPNLHLEWHFSLGLVVGQTCAKTYWHAFAMSFSHFSSED